MGHGKLPSLGGVCLGLAAFFIIEWGGVAGKDEAPGRE
jgi:hypothetical protein